MVRAILAYRIPFEDTCLILGGEKIYTCSCGDYFYVYCGRFHRTTEILDVDWDRLQRAKRRYRGRYPFDIFEVSRNFEDNGSCRCGFTGDFSECSTTEIVDFSDTFDAVEMFDTFETFETFETFDTFDVVNTFNRASSELRLVYVNSTESGEEESDMDDTFEVSVEETGSNGDSVHDPNLTVEELDRQLDQIEKDRQCSLSDKLNNELVELLNEIAEIDC